MILRQKNRKATKGFTKPEILVLAASLFLACMVFGPVFARIREVSKTQLCQYQLTSLGQKCLMFANQNNGELPEPKDSTFSEHGTDYYTYRHTAYPPQNGGITGLGNLWKWDLIESGSDLPFCPGMNQLFGMTMPAEDWNPNGEPTHWNFIGKASYGGTSDLWPEDDHIDWLPMRSAIGVREISYTFGTNNINELDPSKAFLSDLWATDVGNYWKTRETDLNHVDGSNRIINTWYLDGHVSGVVIGPEFFVEQDGVNYLSPNATWTTMLDDK